MKRSTSIIVIIAILLIISFALLYGADHSHAPSRTTPLGTITTTATSTSTLPSDFKIYANTANGFSFYYPADTATVTVGDADPSQDWTYDATLDEPGTLDVTVNIPSSFETKTNFAGARLTVGQSANRVAVADCLAAPMGNMVTEASTTLNGTAFAEFHFGDAGAGNFYDITNYDTIRGGECYSVEAVIHSTDIGNYSPDQGISAFDQPKIEDILNEMVSTFKFN